MLVNGVGAFSSVIAAVQLETLSFAAIVEAFGQLPATSQAALVMAVLSAFIIPIGALVAGAGLAALALERRSTLDFREERWHEVEFTVIYRAVFVRYFQDGLAEREARRQAAAETWGYLGASSVRLLAAGSGHSGKRADGQADSVKGRVHTFLDAHPGLEQQSINQVLLTV